MRKLLEFLSEYEGRIVEFFGLGVAAMTGIGLIVLSVML